jgi:hypothetical protein
MRALGYILLIVGFLAVFHLASDRLSHALRVASEQAGALPQQETFSWKEVEAAILKATLSNRQSEAAAILPGLFMLGGAILLDRARARRNYDGAK